MAKQKESYFWTSYSDLMTSLFFVMLVLFVLACASLNNERIAAEKEKKATEEELAKIKSIEESLKAIDTTFFEYNSEHKKHILKIDVQFNSRSASMADIPEDIQRQLVQAGNSIIKFIKGSPEDVQYLVVIEGQTSDDNYLFNDDLSYQRANALREFWKTHSVDFDLIKDKAELIVSGSGKWGALRDKNDNEKNKRFLIHIIPKPGTLDRVKKNSQ